MIKKYLIERKQKLENIIREQTEKYEHNQIAISKLNNKIKELNNNIDEAMQMFSIKAREDNGFKQQEIEKIENKIEVHMSDSLDCKTILNEKEKELSKVIRCIKELENVSRETFVKQEENLPKNPEYLEVQKDTEDKYDVLEQIKDKVLLCKKIAPIDEQRVLIELDNILRMLS